MFIISLPWKHRELEYLQAKSYLFDLCMEYSPKQSYLVIQNNKVALIGMGTVEGEFSCQIRSRAFTMNGSIEKIINYGNVGFLGKYSSIGDAIHKLFPSNGYCVTNMRLTEYTGQDLKGDINHYSIIEPIVCLVGKNPNDDLQHFFDVLGWGNRKKFSCSGNFEHDMRLFIDNQEVFNLETWFVNYCKIALR